MDKTGYFDYKRPIGWQNDYRTSTYRGHLELPEHSIQPINHDFSLQHKQYLQNIGDEERCLTESQEKFSLKIIQPSIVQTPMANLETHYMKSFQESHLSNYPKLKMPPVSSVSQNDYQWKSKISVENPTEISMPMAIETNKSISIGIDRCKPGFGKLLDPSATTNNLTYREYSTEETEKTSTKNIITFWNWKNTFEKKHTFCSVMNKKCSMNPLREHHNSVKHVPNRGLISEAKSNFVQHLDLSNFDSFNINNAFVNCIGIPNEAKSENTIYGSGIRIQKYLA